MRCALANCAPHPTAFLLGKLGLPAQFVDFNGGLFGVQVGLADEGQRHEFARLGLQCGQLVIEVFSRVQVNVINDLAGIRGHQIHRLCYHAQAVVFHAQARAQPDGVSNAGRVLFEQLFSRAGTALIRFFLRQPHLFELGTVVHPGGHVVCQ